VVKLSDYVARRSLRRASVGGLALLFLAGGCSAGFSPSSVSSPTRPAARVDPATAATTVNRAAAPAPSPTPGGPVAASQSAGVGLSPSPAGVVPQVADSSGGYGCAAAIRYLEATSAPGFEFICPASLGQTLGHEAMTCVDVPGVCPHEREIAIADPCPEAYTNEAYNSWAMVNALAAGQRSYLIDLHGSCRSTG